MMGRAKRPFRHQRRLIGQKTGHRINFGYLQSLFFGEGRQNAGNSLSQHCFSRSRRPLHKKIMAASGGNHQRSFGIILPNNIGKSTAAS